MRTRILTAIPLVCVLIYVLSFSTRIYELLILFTTIIFLAASEFVALRWRAIDKKSSALESKYPKVLRQHFVIGAFIASCLPIQYAGDFLISQSVQHGQYIVFVWIAFCLVFLSVFLYRREDELDIGIQKLLNVLSGFIYLAIPGITVVHLSQLNTEPKGIFTYFGLAAIIMGDTGAYLAGRYFGKRKLLPKVSPKKTMEGAIGGLIASLVTGMIISVFFDLNVPYWQAGIVAICTGLAGQIGDLVESAMKRSANCKDSGWILPGHGGVLDRVDAMIFAIPFTYLLFMLLNKN